MIVDLQVNIQGENGEAIDPGALIEGAKQAGLDGLVVTNGTEVNPDIEPYRKAGSEHGVSVFAGAQLETNQGIILCILPDDDSRLPDEWAEKDDGVYVATSVIDGVEARGGVTVALRPYDRDVAKPMGDHLFGLDGLTACEVQNGSLTEVSNDLALEAASNMEMPCVGSSSAQGLEGLGRAATLLRNPVETQADLCEAVRSGDCWPISFSTEPPRADSSSGPRSGGRGPGGRRGGRRRPDGASGNSSGRRTNNGGRRRARGGRGGSGGGGGGVRGGRSGGGRRGPMQDDIGNRRSGAHQANVADDVGNRVSRDGGPTVEDDIGNRLAPGERSPYHLSQNDASDDE